MSIFGNLARGVFESIPQAAGTISKNVGNIIGSTKGGIYKTLKTVVTEPVNGIKEIIINTYKNTIGKLFGDKSPKID